MAITCLKTSADRSLLIHLDSYGACKHVRHFRLQRLVISTWIRLNFKSQGVMPGGFSSVSFKRVIFLKNQLLDLVIGDTDFEGMDIADLGFRMMACAAEVKSTDLIALCGTAAETERLADTDDSDSNPDSSF